jgi:hypothetical protein
MARQPRQQPIGFYGKFQPTGVDNSAARRMQALAGLGETVAGLSSLAKQFGVAQANELAPAEAALAVEEAITVDPETGKNIYGKIEKRKGWGSEVFNYEIAKGIGASQSIDVQEGMADISLRAQTSEDPLATFNALSEGLLNGLQVNASFSPDTNYQINALVSTYRQDIIAGEVKKGIDTSRANQKRNIDVTSQSALTFISNGNIEAGAQAYMNVLDSYDNQVGTTYSQGEADALKDQFTVEYEVAHSRLGLKTIVDEKGQIAGTQFIEAIIDNKSLPWTLEEKEATVDILTNDLKEIRQLENIKESELAANLKTRQADNASNLYIGITSGLVDSAQVTLAASLGKISFTQLTTLGAIITNRGKGVDDYELINQIRQAQYTNPELALQLISDNTETRLTGKTGSELFNIALGFQARGGELESAEAKRFSNHITDMVVVKGVFGQLDFESQANESKLQIIYAERVLAGESPAVVARDLINSYKGISNIPQPQYAGDTYENSTKQGSDLYNALKNNSIDDDTYNENVKRLEAYFTAKQNEKTFQEDYDSIMKGQQ